MPRKASLEPKVSTVKVPQKNGDMYILERKTVYDPKKHYNRILSTKLIAKIPKGGDKPVPTRPKRTKSASPAGGSPNLTASRMHVGMMDIIDHIGKESGIDDAVYSATDLGTAQKVISLARYLLATGGQTLPGIQTWQYNHPIPYANGITEGVYHELFERTGRDEGLRQNFFAARARALPENDAIAYDSTTVSTYSENQNEARRGFNKAHDGLKTVKLLTLYSISTRQPVAFAKQPGNLPDVITLSNAVRQLEALGMRTAEVVTDNGYYSQQNLSELLLSGFHFITLAKTSIAWIRDEIDSRRGEFASIRTACPFDTNTHGVTVLLTREFQKVRKYADHASGKRKGDVEAFTRRVYLHLFYNPMRYAEDKAAFEADLLEIKTHIESGKAVEDLSDAAREKAAKYLGINRRGGRCTVSFNEEACADANRYHGFFAIVADKEKDTFAALSKYRRRNTVESFYRGEKQGADGTRPRVWTADSSLGRMFVQFVEMCYYEYLNERLRQIKLTLGVKNGDKKHDLKTNLDEELRLKSWIENTPLYLQLQWFDTVENVRVSSALYNKRWSTEITSRDRLYLDKLGVKLTV